MEYGSNNIQGLDHLVGPARGNEIHQSRSSRDWFASNKPAAAEDCFDLMEASPPAANEIYYDHEHVRHVSDHHHQGQQHYAQAQTLGLGIGGQACNNIEREHMFDKVVTPSDVGKLNRLVIPKQHAEKYFPLDTSSNEKGLLLNFEDLTGKSWSFRYSYWNSSQSYVMTKGWSRFVKEKKLDAGDIVSFQRVVGEAEKHPRLFIDWRRRPITTLPFSPSPFHHIQFYRSAGGVPSWSPLLFRPPPTQVHRDINFQISNSPSSHYYNGYNGGNYTGQVVTNDASMVYLTGPEMIGAVRSRPGAAVERIPMVFESVPVVQGKKVVAAAAKRLRLFGVNMECPISSDTSSSDEYEKLSSSSAIPGNHSTAHLNHSSALFPPSSTRMCNGTPVSNKGKMSISFNLDV